MLRLPSLRFGNGWRSRTNHLASQQGRLGRRSVHSSAVLEGGRPSHNRHGRGRRGTRLRRLTLRLGKKMGPGSHLSHSLLLLRQAGSAPNLPEEAARRAAARRRRRTARPLASNQRPAQGSESASGRPGGTSHCSEAVASGAWTAAERPGESGRKRARFQVLARRIKQRRELGRATRLVERRRSLLLAERRSEPPLQQHRSSKHMFSKRTA